MKDHEFHIAANKVLQLAHVSSCSADDCEFVALAKELQIPLVTADKRILREFPETTLSPEEFSASIAN